MKRLALSFALALAACGSPAGYCDFRPKNARCQEREALLITAFEQLCKTSNGTYASGKCPREGSLGGCDLSEPANPIRDWYYPDPDSGLRTAEDVKMKCEGKPYLLP